MKIAITIFVIVVLTSFILLAILKTRSLSDRSGITESNCRTMEAEGHLPKNSCDCTEQIFNDWDHSYDWMDACQIMESKKGSNKYENNKI